MDSLSVRAWGLPFLTRFDAMARRCDGHHFGLRRYAAFSKNAEEGPGSQWGATGSKRFRYANWGIT